MPQATLNMLNRAATVSAGCLFGDNDFVLPVTMSLLLVLYINKACATDSLKLNTPADALAQNHIICYHAYCYIVQIYYHICLYFH